MRIGLMGRRWALRFTRVLSSRGDCDPPDRKGKAIRIHSGLKGKKRLDTLIHEFLHASLWDLDETFVEQFAEDVAAVLYDRLGYRAPEDEED